MKVVFFGTSSFAVTILDHLKAEHEVAAVVTTPDSKVGRKQVLQASPVGQAAQGSGLRLLKPEKLTGDQTFTDALKALGADTFVVASYGKILPEQVINLPHLGTLNAHPSLLPKYRGATPIQTALLNGDTVTGTTIMLIDAEMDHGPILAQTELAVNPDETYPELSQRLADLSAKLLSDVLPKYSSGSLQPREQDHAQATYTKIIKKDDGRIDWTMPARDIYNRYRAFTLWPGIWTTWNRQLLKILECRPVEDASAAPPRAGQEKNAAGQIRPNGIVNCGNESFLQIRTVQLQGKKPTPLADFARGNTAIFESPLGS